MVSAIYSFIRWWIGSGIFDRVKGLVIEMMSDESSNTEKRNYVIAKTTQEYNLLKERVIDLIIAIVLIQLKGQ